MERVADSRQLDRQTVGRGRSRRRGNVHVASPQSGGKLKIKRLQKYARGLSGKGNNSPKIMPS